MLERLRYLLLQVRDADDPMADHEVRCFAGALHCDRAQIRPFNLLGACPSTAELADVDIVLLGGSGDYCVSEGGHWMDPAMDAMRVLHDTGKPTFASCWGFQAMAAALGGHVYKDPSRAEVGTHDVFLTDAGKADPLFSALGDTFPAQMGHQDVVDKVPPDAVLLAKTKLANQAFYFPGKPIYCTQFHPELSKTTLLDRLRSYPKYIEFITGMTYDRFVVECTRETTATDALLLRYVKLVTGDR